MYNIIISPVLDGTLSDFDLKNKSTALHELTASWNRKSTEAILEELLSNSHSCSRKHFFLKLTYIDCFSFFATLVQY